MRLDEPDPVSLTSEVGTDSVVLEGWLARIVPPLVSQPSSSSSARSAKTSGSSSSGGSVDIQHIRTESKIMFPTIRAPFPNEPTGEPMDELVRWVIRAGRAEVPTASKSRRAWSLPSQRRAVGFHFISPTTLGVEAPPGFRIRWGFFFVVDELTARFFFDGASSVVAGFDTKESIRPLRRREFVGNGGTGVASLDSALKLLLDGSLVGFRRRVPLGLLESFSDGFGYDAPGTRVTLG